MIELGIFLFLHIPPPLPSFVAGIWLDTESLPKKEKYERHFVP